MDHAYSILTIKSMDEERRTFRGVATTPEMDRQGDIIVSRGISFKNPLPLLMGHDGSKPVGNATFSPATDAGIEFEASIPLVKEAGTVKDRTDEAWHSVKSKIIRGVSIRVMAMKGDVEPLPGGGMKLNRSHAIELSLTPIPVNESATITLIRSIDQAQRAAVAGIQRSAVVRLSSPVASGTKPKPKGRDMKTIPEQISAFETERQTKAASMEGLMSAAAEKGETLDAAQSEQYDTLSAEVVEIDKHLGRLKTHQALMVSKAVTVKGDTATAGSDTRAAPQIILNLQPDEKFKGQFFTRKVIAKALAYLEQRSQTAIAFERWGKAHPQIVEVIKANEVQGGSGDTWGAELVTADNRFTGDFIEFLNQQTVFDRLGLREVPANVAIKGQDGAATAYWTAESKAIKATAADFSNVNLAPLKVAAVAVISNELLRDSSPAAEMLVRDALVKASAQRIDATFLSADAASAGVSPAGILNGVVSIGSHGSDGDGLRNDVRALYAAFIAAYNASDLSFVTNKSLAKAIQLMVNALGQAEFPGVTQNGGTLLGDPLVTGDNVGVGDLILLKPSDIYRIGDTGVRIEISRDATIEMATDPTGASDTPAGQTKNPVSMFQTESTAIKVVRSVNWAKRRASAVQYIRDAAYNESAST